MKNYKEMAITVGLVVVGVILATIAVEQFAKWQKNRTNQDHAEVDLTAEKKAA